MNSSDSEEIIKTLRRKSYALQKVYSDYRSAFINYAIGLGVFEEDAKDIYHDSIMAFRDNIFTDRLTKSCSLFHKNLFIFLLGKIK